MDYYDYLESKLKNEFIKENKIKKVNKGKIRRLQQIKKANKNLIHKYTKKEEI